MMGLEAYRPIAAKYHVPIVVTGFEPLDILQGVGMCVRQLEEGRAEVENQYARCVRAGGNPTALATLAEVVEVVPRKWRGIGEIAASGWALRGPYAAYDAERRFGLAGITAPAQSEKFPDQWIAAQANLRTWSADVVETRALKTLSQPLVSAGKVWVAIPDRFRWELGQPAQTIALRQPDQLCIIYP